MKFTKSILVAIFALFFAAKLSAGIPANYCNLDFRDAFCQRLTEGSNANCEIRTNTEGNCKD
jgi:hypothetical protein